jgi:RNA polymerase sigma factor (sigma-70 family)
MSAQYADRPGPATFGRVSAVVTGTPREPEPLAERQMDWPSSTDDELAAGFAAGDEQCLEVAFRRWAPLIYTVALRTLDSPSEAEEVTQQVFVGAWRGRATYQPSSGSLPGWLVGICKHRIADRQRARGRELRLVRAVSSEADVRTEPEPLTTIVDRVVLADELQRLPDPRGAILRLAFWEGQSYPQIAEQLDLPLGTVKSHARRGLLHLRTRLQEVPSWST